MSSLFLGVWARFSLLVGPMSWFEQPVTMLGVWCCGISFFGSWRVWVTWSGVLTWRAMGLAQGNEMGVM
jgi:hypothetical protein